MLEHLDCITHPRFVALPKLIFKRRFHKPCRQPPTTGAAGQLREMPANAPGVRLLLNPNQIIEVKSE